MLDFLLRTAIRSTDAWNKSLVYVVDVLRKTKPQGHNFILLHWEDNGVINYGTDLKGAELKARLQQAADKVIA